MFNSTTATKFLARAKTQPKADQPTSWLSQAHKDVHCLPLRTWRPLRLCASLIPLFFHRAKTPRAQSLKLLLFLAGLLLSSCALVAPDKPDRTVRVRILADQKLRESDPRWSETAGALLRGASDFFAREFGVRFVAQKIEPWSHKEESPAAADLLARLKKDFASKDQPEGYDLIVAFTGEPLSSYSGGKGMAILGDCDRGLGNYLVSRVTEPYRYSGANAAPPLDVIVLVHELGHIFGADHVSDPRSIMNDNFDYREDFDMKSRAIVLKNKLCAFRK